SKALKIAYVFQLMTAPRAVDGQRIFRCDCRSVFRPLAHRGSPGTRKMSSRWLPPWSIAATTSSRFPPWYCRWRADSLLQMAELQFSTEPRENILWRAPRSARLEFRPQDLARNSRLLPPAGFG